MRLATDGQSRAGKPVLELRFSVERRTNGLAHSCCRETSRDVGVAGFASGLSREGQPGYEE
jgi:hypothetical protein